VRPVFAAAAPRWKGTLSVLLSFPAECKVRMKYILGAAMKLALKLFFLPGDLVANALHAQNDDRMMIRTLIDMLFWNAVIVVGAVVIFL
jgi:hypothetical protein